MPTFDFRRVNHRGANFYRVHLEGAYFSETDLSGANLREAMLNGADLRGARELAWEQIEQALGNAETKLPVGFSSPWAWY